MSSWYPATLSIFYEGAKRREWSSIPTERMETFFKTISLIMGDQLRYIVKKSIQEFLALIASKPFTPGDNAKTLSFSVRLVLEENKIVFEPTLSEIQNTVEGILDALLLVADRIPKVETQLFSQGQASYGGNKALTSNLKPEQCIPVAFETTFPRIVSGAKETLKASLTSTLQAPSNYLAVYDKLKSLITKSAYTDVDNFLAEEAPIDKFMDEVKKYRAQATTVSCAYARVAIMPLIELQCEELIGDLSNRSLELSEKILGTMAVKNSEINSQ